MIMLMWRGSGYTGYSLMPYGAFGLSRLYNNKFFLLFLFSVFGRNTVHFNLVCLLKNIVAFAINNVTASKQSKAEALLLF